MNHRERLAAAIATLSANHGLAVTFSKWGAHIVGEDNLADYRNHAKVCGTDRWVGTHVGSREHGGADFDAAGMLRYRHNNEPVDELWWSFNHNHPELADVLVRRFGEQGLDAHWPGGDSCVIVRLGGAR